MAQRKLPGTSVRRKVGAVERAAGADLATLRQLGVIPAGSTALEATYRRLAQQVDAATDEADRYGVINSARELRNVRGDLGAAASAEDEAALDRVIAAIMAQLTGEE